MSPKKTDDDSYKVKVPLTVQMDSENVKELENELKVVKGEVNGEEAWILRDTGCTTVCMSREFAERLRLNSKAERWITLANGSECICHEIEIDLKSPYLSGTVLALTMDCPFADIILGESAFMKVDYCSREPEQNLTEKCRLEKINQDSGCSKNLELKKEVENTEEMPMSRIVSGIGTRSMKTLRETEEREQAKTEEKFLMEKNSTGNKESTLYALEKYISGKENLRKDQREDHTLTKVRELTEIKEVNRDEPYFMYKENVLYRRFKMPNGEIIDQIVVPEKYRKTIMEVAHDMPFGGHLGNKKTRERILNQFYWPGIFPTVAKFCQSCENCQKCIPKGRIPKVHLIPIQQMEEPFKRIALDIVGPLNKSKRGHKYILVICDYATKYPEAIPLKTIDSETVANALIETFSRVGLPGEILSDQGSNFMSALMVQLCLLLKINKINTSSYHPQANGLVEDFNGTLKKMLRCYAKDEPDEWDKHIPFVLFAYREAPYESTGYSPFQLLYGRNVRGPLQLMKESWVDTNEDGNQESVVSYVLQTRDRLKKMQELAQVKEIAAKKKQKKYFDQKCKVRELDIDQKVLVLLPTSRNKLLAEWKGPFKVLEKVSPVDYRIQMNRRKMPVFHTNMLKPYFERKNTEEERYEAIQCLDIICSIEDSVDDDIKEMVSPTIVQQESTQHVTISEELMIEQQLEVKEFLKTFGDVFTDVPGKTNLITYDVKLKEEKPIVKKPYCLPFALRSQVKKEIESMINFDIIENSTSSWAAPIVCVPKKDKSIRLCIDYRGLNTQTVFDPQPMPKIDEIINKLGKAKYISK